MIFGLTYAFFASQILASIAIIADVFSFQFKARKTIIVFFMIAATCIAAHYFLLERYAATAVVTLGIIRFFIAYHSTGIYLKILFEPFFEKKGQYLFHIFVSISLLLIGLGSIELIRRLILSIEEDVGFGDTAMYGIYAAFLIVIVFVGRLYFSYLRPKNITSIQSFFYNKYLKNYILLD